MKRIYLVFAVAALLVTGHCGVATAQVAIGSETVTAGAVLDLTNSDQLGLLLPKVNYPASSQFPHPLEVEGMVVYYQSDKKIYTYTGTAWVSGASSIDLSTYATTNQVTGAIADAANTKVDKTFTINDLALTGTGITLNAGAIGALGENDTAESAQKLSASKAFSITGDVLTTVPKTFDGTQAVTLNTELATISVSKPSGTLSPPAGTSFPVIQSLSTDNKGRVTGFTTTEINLPPETGSLINGSYVQGADGH
jgi:hypothetical protein